MSKGIRKALAALLIAVAALVFFNRSVLYWTTPKVLVEKVVSGSLKYKKSIAGLTAKSDKIQAVSSPVTLPEGLAITWFMDENQTRVEKGEPLLKVDPSILNGHLQNAQSAYDQARVALSAFELHYPQARTEAEKAYAKADADMKKARNATGKQAEKLRNAYNAAHARYEQVVLWGIFESNTLDGLKMRLALAEAEVRKLQTIRDDGYALRAPCSGVILSSINLRDTASLPPNKTIAQILPDDAPITLDVTIAGALPLSDDQKTVVLSDPLNPLHQLSLDILASERRGADTHLTLAGEALDGFRSRLDKLAAYNLIYESPFYPTLIPDSALITENSVYTVQEVYADQRKQYRIKEVEVRRGTGNGYHIPLLDSLPSGMLLVTGWDREIRSGDIVMIVERNAPDK